MTFDRTRWRSCSRQPSRAADHVTRRAELVEELGIDVFLVMPFTTDFMKLTPDRYNPRLLVDTCTRRGRGGGELHLAKRPQAPRFAAQGGRPVRFRGAGMSLVSEHTRTRTSPSRPPISVLRGRR